MYPLRVSDSIVPLKKYPYEFRFRVRCFSCTPVVSLLDFRLWECIATSLPVLGTCDERHRIFSCTVTNSPRDCTCFSCEKCCVCKVCEVRCAVIFLVRRGYAQREEKYSPRVGDHHHPPHHRTGTSHLPPPSSLSSPETSPKRSHSKPRHRGQLSVRFDLSAWVPHIH